MFKKLETAWNSRTPVWLHNGTKENLIFQISGAILIFLGLSAYDRWETRRFNKRMKDTTPNEN